MSGYMLVFILLQKIEKLEEELKALRESEMWQTAVTVRKLRPENN